MLDKFAVQPTGLPRESRYTEDFFVASDRGCKNSVIHVNIEASTEAPVHRKNVLDIYSHTKQYVELPQVVVSPLDSASAELHMGEVNFDYWEDVADE